MSHLYPGADFESWSDCAAYVPHAKAVLGHSVELVPATESKLSLSSKLATYLWYRDGGGGRRAGGAGDGDEQEELGAGASRHADQHGQPGVDVPESRPVGRGRGAGGAGDGDEQEDARSRSIRHADQHGQPGVDVQESRPVGGGGELEVQVMETSKRKLGGASDTLTSMANLASTYRNQGRWKEAEKLEVQVMETSKRMLGAGASRHADQHGQPGVDVLESRPVGGGREAGGAGDGDEQEVLGEEHPDTLTSMANLASTYRNQGRWKEAEKLEVQVMETRKTKLGAGASSTR